MTLPNFLVIGAAKAGTSSLEQYLKQHPQIYFNSVWRELRFFAYEDSLPTYSGPGDAESNRHTVSLLEQYEAYFEGVSTEKAIGEVSPVYLYSERAPERIQRYIPDARLIVILRNPVERAYSHYRHLVRDGREPDTFARALAREDERMRENWEWSWQYRRVGLYREQLERYYERFDRAQIRVFLYEDFQTRPLFVIGEIFRFLEVDDAFAPNMAIRHNVSGIPRSRLLSRSLMLIRKGLKRALTPAKPYIPPSVWLGGAAAIWGLYNANRRTPALDGEIQRSLAAYYREDVLRLETLVDRDLSNWLESPTHGSSSKISTSARGRTADP